MYALVENNTVTKLFTYPKGFVLNNVQYSADIFTKWTTAEKNAIGIYEVITDSTNKKDEKWYINTNESFTFADGQVTRSWGTATAKAHADSTVDGETVKGLKTILIEQLKQQVANELAKTDWYIIRKQEKTTAIPSAISTHRDAVRTKQAEMETAITNATDTPALETLYTYTLDDDGNSTRPLGELPTLES